MAAEWVWFTKPWTHAFTATWHRNFSRKTSPRIPKPSHAYQYVFKRNNETIPYKLYGKPIVDTAIKTRIGYLATKADTLFSLSIYYIILFEGFRYTRSLGSTLLEIPKRPAKALSELRAHFSGKKQVFLLDREITRGQVSLLQKVESFILQVSDFVRVRLLNKQEAFRILKQTLC